MKKITSVNRQASSPPQSQRIRPLPMLNDIHKKIQNSTALNGGFDALMYKIDKIEQSQSQVVTKVDKIHDAIYDPKDGIFAKLSEQRHASDVGFKEINVWRSMKEEETKKEEVEDNKTQKKIDTLEKSVDSLVKAKTATWGIVKWLAIALGGGGVTLLFGWLGNWIK